MLECGNLRLIHFKDIRRLSLRESSALDDLRDLVHQFGLRRGLFRSRVSQVGKDIVRSNDVVLFRCHASMLPLLVEFGVSLQSLSHQFDVRLRCRDAFLRFLLEDMKNVHGVCETRQCVKYREGVDVPLFLLPAPMSGYRRASITDAPARRVTPDRVLPFIASNPEGCWASTTFLRPLGECRDLIARVSARRREAQLPVTAPPRAPLSVPGGARAIDHSAARVPSGTGHRRGSSAPRRRELVFVSVMCAVSA